MPAQPVDHPELSSSLVDEAAAQVVVDLVGSAAVVDLRDSVDEPLRAGGRSAAPAFGAGCPCGCLESELLTRAQAGDAGATTELLQRYQALARSKARSYFVLGGDREDVVQEAMIGLFKAIRDFDAERGVPFRSFAEVCVTRQVLSAVKGAARHKHSVLSRAVPLDRPASEDAPRPLSELLPAVSALDPAALVIAADEVRALRRHVDEVLTDLEAQILRHHLDGKSYGEIAAMLQRHVKAVDNALQRIRRKVAAHVNDRQIPEAAG